MVDQRKAEGSADGTGEWHSCEGGGAECATAGLSMGGDGGLVSLSRNWSEKSQNKITVKSEVVDSTGKQIGFA